MEGIDWGLGGRLAAVIWLGRKECAERDGSERCLASYRHFLFSGGTQHTSIPSGGEPLNFLYI